MAWVALPPRPKISAGQNQLRASMNRAIARKGLADDSDTRRATAAPSTEPHHPSTAPGKAGDWQETAPEGLPW
jgi:hypothetical protein